MSSNTRRYFTIRRDSDSCIFHWVIDTIDMTDAEFGQYGEISCPFVCGNRSVLCCVAVKHNSAWRLPDNGVASSIFGTNIWGDCVFCFEDATDTQVNRMLNLIWKHISAKGYTTEHFLPSTLPKSRLTN